MIVTYYDAENGYLPGEGTTSDGGFEGVPIRGFPSVRVWVLSLFYLLAEDPGRVYMCTPGPTVELLQYSRVQSNFLAAMRHGFASTDA